MVKFACQLSKVEQCVGRQVKGELGFCSDPDSRSLAEQYEGGCDGDEDTVLYSTTVTLYYYYYYSLLYGRVGLHLLGTSYHLKATESLCFYVGLHILCFFVIYG